MEQIKKHRERLNRLRVKFFTIETEINKELAQGEANQNERYRMINNHGEISRQGNQISNIQRSGQETANVMSMANRDMQRQRQDIIKIANTNNQIMVDANKAEGVLKSIRMAELRHKLCLFSIIVMLAIAFLLILYSKIVL